MAIAAILVFYIKKRLDCAQLEKDIKDLKEKQTPAYAPLELDFLNLRPLDKDTAMEAIRYNGYVPDFDGKYITFMVQGEQYIVYTERLPFVAIRKQYNVDSEKWNMDLLREAAHQVSDELLLGKALICGEDEDGLAFQVGAIETTYGHFKDCLPRYVSILEDTQARMGQLYNQMVNEQKQKVESFQLFADGPAEGKSIAS